MTSARSIARSLHIAFLSAPAGCFISTVIFCTGVLVFGEGLLNFKGIVVLSMMGALVGTMGLLVSIPTALIAGTPLVWLLAHQIVSSPRVYAALFALVGAGSGWVMFLWGFNDGLGSMIDISRYACPLYGAGVAGVMPLIASWLTQPEKLPQHVSLS